MFGIVLIKLRIIHANARSLVCNGKEITFLLGLSPRIISVAGATEKAVYEAAHLYSDHVNHVMIVQWRRPPAPTR